MIYLSQRLEITLMLDMTVYVNVCYVDELAGCTRFDAFAMDGEHFQKLVLFLSVIQPVK